MTLHIKRPGTPRPISRSMQTYSANNQKPPNQDILAKIPLSQTSSERAKSILEQPYIRKRGNDAVVVQPSQDEVKNSLHIIQQTPQLENYVSKSPIAQDKQAVYVILAEGIKFARSANISELNYRLEDLKDLNKLPKSELSLLHNILHQIAYDTCISGAERAASTGETSLISLYLEKSNKINSLAKDIHTISDDKNLEIWENSYINQRKNLIISALSYAVKGNTVESRKCFKEALSVHNTLDESPINISTMDPIYVLALGKNFSLGKTLEHPQLIDHDVHTFMQYILLRSAMTEVKREGSQAFEKLEILHDSINMLKDLSDPESLYKPRRQTRQTENAKEVTQKVLRILKNIIYRIEIPNDSSSSSKELSIFLKEHTQNPLSYNQKSIEKSIESLLKKENFLKSSTQNESLEKSLQDEKINLLYEHQKEIESSIKMLLRAGASTQNATIIAIGLLQVDLEAHEYLQNQARLHGNPEPKLDLFALKTPSLLGVEDIHHHFQELSKREFVHPVEMTSYVNTPETYRNPTQRTSVQENIGELYQRFYNFQSRTVVKALETIEKIPYSERPEFNENDAHKLRLINIDLLQYKIISDVSGIEDALKNRNNSASNNKLLQTKLVDILNNFTKLEHNAERANIELPLPQMQDISILAIEQNLAILERERLDQRAQQKMATGTTRSVHFGENEVRTYEIDRNDDVIPKNTPNIEDHQFLYNQALKNVHYYAEESDVDHLIVEIEEVRTQSERLNLAFPEKTIENELQRCYNASINKHLAQAVNSAKDGDVGLMLHHLRTIPFYTTLANRKVPDFLPIMKLGYAESIKKALSMLDIDPDTKLTKRLLRNMEKVSQQAEIYAKDFTAERIAQHLAL